MDIKHFGLFCIAVIVFGFFWRLRGRKRRYFIKNGVPDKAKIISIEKTLVEVGTGYSNAKPIMKIVLEINNIGKRRVTIKQPFYTWDIPKEGDQVGVLIDPKNLDKVLLYPDEKSSYNQ